MSSFVVALYGPWGSGKTSLKNMTLDALKRQKGKSPIIIEFNPWQTHGAERLVEQFFAEISRAMEHASTTEEGRLRARKLKEYGSLVEFGSRALSYIGDALELCDVPGRTLVRKIAEAGKKAGGMLSESGQLLNNSSLVSPDSLTACKRDLAAALATSDDQFLVVLDDIDRLTAKEIAVLFQLVKANTDLPNMVYLFLCDRAIVEASLEQIAPKTESDFGAQFLDKIVQMPLTVPSVATETKLRLVQRMVGKVVALIDSKAGISAQDASAIECLSDLCRGLRDIKRLQNTLTFCVFPQSVFRVRELYVRDFILVHALRMFEPRSVDRMIERKGDLLICHGEGSSIDRQSLKKRLLSIGEAASERSKASITRIIIMLFPQISWIYTNLSGWEVGTVDLEAALTKRRICHPEFFDYYFQ